MRCILIVLLFFLLGSCTPVTNCLPAPSDHIYLAYKNDSAQFMQSQFFQSPSIGLVRELDTIYLSHQLIYYQGVESAAVLVEVDWLNNSQDYKLLLHDNDIDTIRLFWELEIQECTNAARRRLDSISYNGEVVPFDEVLFAVQK